jgi:putative intracellular protease/amidase
MLSMTKTVHVALYDTLADWEVGHLLVELRTGRFTGEPWRVVTVGESTDPVVSMGGVRLLPDVALADVDPGASDLLVLAGSEAWDQGGGGPFADLATRFAAVGVPVAAICGATVGLARVGLLDDRAHTSAAAGYLAATGYAGGDRYVEERAVADRGVVTAGPGSPVQFSRATLEHVGLMSAPLGAAYEGVFDRDDDGAHGDLVALLQPA